ncbi:MAG: hypothetical protein H5T59_13915, partial [Anaerolineae bacterium]|nr:hypothetical protein [Anaerolineae bacterium]
PASWNASATGYTLWPLPGESYFALVFNARRPALRQPEVRWALAGLVDRGALLQGVGGKGLVLDAPLPPGHWALAGGLPTAAEGPGDGTRALAAAGWADDDGDGWREFRGQAQVLAVETNAENPQRLQVALLVAEQLRAAGVPAELQTVEWAVLLTDLARHNFDLAVLDLPFHVEPAACTLWREDTGRARKPLNWPGLGEEDLKDLEALLEGARAVPGCAPEDRAVRYGDVWAWLERERPFLVLLSPARWLAADTALQGVVASPFRPWYWNLNRWYWTAEPER